LRRSPAEGLIAEPSEVKLASMKIQQLDVSAYRIPTDRPEADGTIAWNATTLLLVEVAADSGTRGLGFSYASAAAGRLARDVLAPLVVGQSADEVGRRWETMVAAVRNAGRPGVAATAIAAVDVALWDLKARALDLPLFKLLGPYRDAVSIYGSGGFTTYSEADLADQLGGWVGEGIPRVKMKIGKDGGTRPEEDVARVRVARRAIGDRAELMVDANGAYQAKQAIALGQRFAEAGVAYFEEPVASDQLEQLAFVRAHVPQAVAVGEYAYDPWYVREMLRSGAVDVQQADATRCLGITGWLQDAAKWRIEV
jgi:L-alanine-DL-glutamate epimerase-like enolase superfamily enzyme